MTANPAPDDRPRAVVLVEGMSDRLALEVLVRRRGRDLAAHGVAVIAMHGATNLGHYLELYGPGGLNVRLAGLCDAAEEDYFRRALRRAGIGAEESRAAMEALGFFVCTLDLEDELRSRPRLIQARQRQRGLERDHTWYLVHAAHDEKPSNSSRSFKIVGLGGRPYQPAPQADAMKERSLPLPGGCWKLQGIRLHQAREAPSGRL